jgi:2,3-bisphosphoglycerate-independent phosphoglycerate mutase
MKKILLVILDGRGIANDQKISAISPETTPYYFSLLNNYPHTQLEASELAVGLPVGQVGNSEVGHTTL